MINDANGCYALKHVFNHDHFMMCNCCKVFLEEFQKSNSKFLCLNKKEILSRMKRIISIRRLPHKQEEKIYNKEEKYTAFLERDEKNTDKFRRWDAMDYLIYNILNEKFPLNLYGHIVWFLLNLYDPEVQYVDINQYYLKQECDKKIKEDIKKENIQLKNQFKQYQHNMTNRLHRIEIMHEVKRRQDIKKIHNNFYGMIIKIKEEQNLFQQQMKTQYINKFNGIENNKKLNPTLTATTKIENCTLHNCLIVGDNNNNKIHRTKKRKYNNNLYENGELHIDTKEREEHNLSTLINEISEKIINILKDETLRENLAECLERKSNCWEYGGFVCTTNNNKKNHHDYMYKNNQNEKQEYQKCIFLKKGNDKWMELLQILGYHNIVEKEIDLNILKHRLVCRSKRVRLDGVQNKNTVNKRQCVVLSL